MSQPPQPRGLLFVEFTGAGAQPSAAAAGPDTLERHHIVLIGAAKKLGGIIAKSAQNSHQIVFSGPEQAIRGALALLFRFAEHNKGCEDPGQKVSLRQTVHGGAFQLQGDGVPGEPAEVLAQLLKVTPAGRIFSTRAAYAPSLGKAPCEFIPLGWEYLPGLRAPVDVFEVVPAPGTQGSQRHDG